MKFTKLVREDTQVQFIYDAPNAENHQETFDITAHEAPHPEMDTALEALAPVVKRIMELGSVATIEPYSITISHTKHGTRSATIGYNRKIGATDKVYKFKTVAFKIDDPAEDEEGQRQCKAAESKLIIAVINEGIRYSKGERQQILLPLDDPNAEPKGGSKHPANDPLFPGGGESGDAAE